MKKWDFVKLVAQRTNQSQELVNQIIDEAGRVIVEQVRDGGEEIAIPTIGSFRQKVNKARIARNPLNGKEIKTKESRTVSFRPMPSVKTSVD